MNGMKNVFMTANDPEDAANKLGRKIQGRNLLTGFFNLSGNDMISIKSQMEIKTSEDIQKFHLAIKKYQVSLNEWTGFAL